jgi:hypothetical protein
MIRTENNGRKCDWKGMQMRVSGSERDTQPHFDDMVARAEGL